MSVGYFSLNKAFGPAHNPAFRSTLLTTENTTQSESAFSLVFLHSSAETHRKIAREFPSFFLVFVFLIVLLFKVCYIPFLAATCVAVSNCRTMGPFLHCMKCEDSKIPQAFFHVLQGRFILERNFLHRIYTSPSFCTRVCCPIHVQRNPPSSHWGSQRWLACFPPRQDGASNKTFPKQLHKVLCAVAVAFSSWKQATPALMCQVQPNEIRSDLSRNVKGYN